MCGYSNSIKKKRKCYTYNYFYIFVFNWINWFLIGINIEVTERFKDRLVEEGFNPAYGARPLRRAIMRLLED